LTEKMPGHGCTRGRRWCGRAGARRTETNGGGARGPPLGLRGGERRRGEGVEMAPSKTANAAEEDGAGPWVELQGWPKFGEKNWVDSRSIPSTVSPPSRYMMRGTASNQTARDTRRRLPRLIAFTRLHCGSSAPGVSAASPCRLRGGVDGRGGGGDGGLTARRNQQVIQIGQKQMHPRRCRRRPHAARSEEEEEAAAAAAAIAAGPRPRSTASNAATSTWALPPHPPPSCVRSPRQPGYKYGCGGYLISQILVAARGLKLKHFLSDLQHLQSTTDAIDCSCTRTLRQRRCHH
jgi:hypothetical protein